MGEPIGIIGAGITGLATAYVLSANHKVTIIARDLPGDLGLNWASPWFVPSLSPFQAAIE
jgi:glycine/D-amino acid oxidase-like deaminating enzyme